MTKDNVIDIDMNKPCIICGVMGAMQNDMCISCASDVVGDTHEKLTIACLKSAASQINVLLMTHSPQIHRAYMASEDGKMAVGIKVELTASKEVQNAMNVLAKIDFIESRVKDESVVRVSRHASGEPFQNQVICEVARRLAGNIVAGPLQQAVKKCYESGRLPRDRAIAELYGAINYIAAAIIVLEEQPGDEVKVE